MADTRAGDKPLVSVVIPVFNAGPYLVQCLESVFGQGYEPLEVIAVDNGSTDDSLEILDRYAGRLSVLQEAKRGAAAARNAGVRTAAGELIAFQDADDVWMPGKLSAQVDYLQAHPEIGIVFGQFANWWPDAEGHFESPDGFAAAPDRWQVTAPLSGWIYADQLLYCPIAMITPVVRRQVFETVGLFDEDLEAGEDYDFWLRATYRFRAHKLPTCVALYRQHAGATTRRPRGRNTTALVLERAIQRTGLRCPDGRKVSQRQVDAHFAELWLTFALSHLTHGHIPTGLAALRRYFAFDPDRRKAWWTSAKAVPWALRRRYFGRTPRGAA